MSGPTRRRVMEAAAAALAPASAAIGAEVSGERPNFLFILADDLGAADLGCYGARSVRTPVLDGLAADGLRLTQAYANSAVCSATRTALITGRYQDRLPVGLDEPIPGYDPGLGLPRSQPTLPRQLGEADYQTWLVGKWHLGTPPDFGPLQAGYQRFFGFHYGAADYFSHAYHAPDQPDAPFDGLYEDERAVRREGYLTDILADEAQRMIRGRRRDRPFLLSLHFNAPHWPWEGPGDREHSARLTSLRDNDGGSLAPFVGMKGELLEGGIRVPALVRWPGRTRPGSTSEQVCASMDWLPTFLAAAGAPPRADAPTDGTDIGPQLAGAPVRPRRLFWRYKAQAQSAVRDGDLKYLRIATQERLFDLAADVHERADLRTKRPDDFARLKAAWAEWNAGMLPYPVGSESDSPKGRLVDRY